MHAVEQQASGPSALWRRFAGMLAAPVDGASLALFRIAFGLVMCWHTLKYVIPRGGVTLIEYHFVNVGWNLPYPGFEWVRPWPEPWLSAHFLLVAAAGLFLALGLFYRIAAVTLFLSYTYVFLLEASLYNNHYYLMCLVQFLLIWMPAHRRFSIDGWWNARRSGRGWTDRSEGSPGGSRGLMRFRGFARSAGTSPGHPQTTIPFWPVYLLRAQLFVMYFYGGLAKFNVDWLTGVPMRGPGGRLREFLVESAGLPDWISSSHVCLFLAWGGLAYDLSIGFLLLFRRTRWLAIALTAVFHGTNHFLFPIGVFPVMAFAATLIFFDCDWPVRLWAWLKRPRIARPDFRWLLGGALAVPVIGMVLGWKPRAPESSSRASSQSAFRLRRLVPAFVAVWMAAQILLPFRHNFLEGDANWTEEGQNFAWRMMLRAKSAGHVLFTLNDATVLKPDEHGRASVAWDRLPGDQPQAIYLPFDCHLFNWDRQVGLTVTFEPAIGHRIIFHPPPGEEIFDAELSESRARITGTWQKLFGRTPLVRETIGLREALANLTLRVESAREADEEGRARVLARLGRLQAFLAAPTGRTSSERTRRLVALADEIQHLVESSLGQMACEELSRVHPFLLQGPVYPGRRFLVVDDPKLTAAERPAALTKLSGDAPYIVWVDLSRLRPEAWQELPQSFVAIDDGRLTICWNHFRELNRIQMERLSVRPIMIHQYANHIARSWHQQTGRRPEVRASSFVMLNYHTPRYLIDPDLDLAATPYRFLSHNDWILPRSHEPLKLAGHETAASR